MGRTRLGRGVSAPNGWFRGGVPGMRTGPDWGGSRPPGGRGRRRPRRRLPVRGSAPFRGRGDLRRRAASAGHGGVEPGRDSVSAPRDPRVDSGGWLSEKCQTLAHAGGA
ncbi:bolA-like protein 3 isoform X2 [Panthera pardus]|uniref:BolA-like protein 3 isoform X2 n=1 Tax=Panthera pardus TaxID=9691 RepID=A0A9W2UKK0_PANPR|nr:bolA-like protein 3 isoform X2 [Panthera pardus]